MLDMATQASCALITESCKKNMIYNCCDIKKKKAKTINTLENIYFILV